MTDAPKRIWVEGAVADLRWEDSEDTCMSPHGPYILATPEALAASPEVQALIAAERERCAKIVLAFYPHRAKDIAAAIRETKP